MNQISPRRSKPLIVALDFPDAAATLDMLGRLDPLLCRVKIGKELFTHCGPALVREVVQRGFDVFLDLKFHDIPNTVAGAIAAAVELGVWMVNVHASGGRVMLEAASRAVAGSNTLLTAVTVLTSLGAEDLQEVGISDSPEAQVLRLAHLAQACGVDGVVCSAREIVMLRRSLPEDFLLVTPGIRPAGDSAGDQKRIATPASAISDGGDFLVIGRPVTQSADPTAKLRDILAEIHSRI